MRKAIIELARSMRANPTPAEKFFWDIVKTKKFFNCKFFRQYPLYVRVNGMKRFFIADFYCAKSKLVVEIDGEIHKTQKEDDEDRTELIKYLGIKVIRFTNQDILNNLKRVQKALKESLLLS